jgi:hypothetical protein
MDDAEIVRTWNTAVRCYRRIRPWNRLPELFAMAMIERLEEAGVTEADIDRLIGIAPAEDWSI